MVEGDPDDLGLRCFYSGMNPGYHGRNCVECKNLGHDYEKTFSNDGRSACTGFTIHEDSVHRQIRIATEHVNVDCMPRKDISMKFPNGDPGHASAF